MRFSFGGGFEQRTLRAEELAGDVESLASHDNDLLAVEELLGDCAGEATEQVTLAVNDNLQKASVCVFITGCEIVRGARVRLTTGSKVDILPKYVTAPQDKRCRACGVLKVVLE